MTMKSKQPIYRVIRNLETQMQQPVSELAIPIMMANNQKIEVLEGEYYIVDGVLKPVQKIIGSLKEEVLNYMQPSIVNKEEKKSAIDVDNNKILDNKINSKNKKINEFGSNI